jgi:hypothetical protein
MMAAQWIDAGYGYEKLDLGIVIVSVGWASVPKGDPTGYDYRFGNYKSKRLYKTMDEAKEAALTSLDTKLAAARNSIEQLRTIK